MFKTIVHNFLKLNWKYTKFCRQTATCKGYLRPKLENSQDKKTLFSCQVIFKFVIVITKFVIFVVTSTHTIDHQFVNVTPI